MANPCPACTPDAYSNFEQHAEAFYKATGIIAPGKDRPVAMNSDVTESERWHDFFLWFHKEHSL